MQTIACMFKKKEIVTVPIKDQRTWKKVIFWIV